MRERKGTKSGLPRGKPGPIFNASSNGKVAEAKVEKQFRETISESGVFEKKLLPKDLGGGGKRLGGDPRKEWSTSVVVS